MIDYAAYILVKFLNKILAFVPLSFSLWVGRRLGALAFLVNKKRRLVAYANLKAAFSRERSPKELKAITKRVYQNLIQTVVEILNLTKVNRRYVDRYVEVVNMERIRSAAKSGRGTILLTGHFGDWELSSLVSAVVGFPILVLAREQKMKRVNELLNQLRESNGCRVIRKGISTKNILKALYGKNIVGILSDQDAGKNGMFIDFFGRQTSSHSGPMEMAKRTDSIVLPNFIVRTKGPYHKLYLEEYIDFRDIKKQDDIKLALQRFASLLESYVRQYPDQWLWLHKRWKSTPARTILVLNDGKAGHLNQALAIAQEIRKARATQGYALEDTKIEVVDVKFKNRLSRNILSLCATFASWRCHGCMRCMRLCLEEGSYDTLMKTYSEFVVSCGSGLSAVNIFMSKENNAKNMVVMKPNILMGLRKFSLAVIPRHDRPAKARNVVEVAIAPNLIDSALLEKDGEELQKRIKLDRERRIGLFIGGDNPEFSLTHDIMENVIDNIARFCEAHNADILATTSRRTSDQVARLLKGRLHSNPRCKLLVIANESNLSEAVGGILGLSEILVISGESISMISEAISAGKKVVVFKLNKKDRCKTKHELALESLEEDGYINISEPSSLSATLEKVAQEDRPVKKLDDRARIFEAVRRLI